MQRLTWLTAILIFSAGMLAGLHLPPADHASLVPVSVSSLQSVDLPIEASKTQVATYVASKEQDPFHYRACKSAAKISPANREIFKSRKAALEAGHRPCKICRP